MARACRRQGAFPRADARGAPGLSGTAANTDDAAGGRVDLGSRLCGICRAAIQSGAWPRTFRRVAGLPPVALAGRAVPHALSIVELCWPEISNMFG